MRTKEEIAEIKVRLEYLAKEIEKVNVDNYDFRDYKRQFMDVVRELGFNFDDKGVLDRDVKLDSALGKLQAQISALVDALGYKETYDKGTLRYDKGR